MGADLERVVDLGRVFGQGNTQEDVRLLESRPGARRSGAPFAWSSPARDPLRRVPLRERGGDRVMAPVLSGRLSTPAP